MAISRDDVLRYRIQVQGLDGAGRDDILDIGVQDTGPDGGRWALELRGVRPDPAQLVLVWTLRGAPHLYRRAEIAQVARAVSPLSEADARKRVFDAAKPLVKAGIAVADALDEVGTAMREIVTAPTAKGEVSRQLSAVMPEPYLRYCRPCQATHLYEQVFRLSALFGGLELEPDTSPPVLTRIPRWRGRARSAPERLDPVRAALHLLGPADHKAVAAFLDSPVTEVRKRWPDDAVAVEVDGVQEWILSADRSALEHPASFSGVRLLGPFDLYLQTRDRERLVPDDAARKDLWRTLGRPGGVLVDGEVVGSWRPRSAGSRLALAVTLWNGEQPGSRIAAEAERLAHWRGKAFAGLV